MDPAKYTPALKKVWYKMWCTGRSPTFCEAKMAHRKKKRRKFPEKVLSTVQIRSINKPGRYTDGNGLYLVVDDSGARRWVLRTVVKGKRCDLGLGGFSIVSLADAREEAARLRKIARCGGDPIALRRQERRVVPTLEAAARASHADPVRSFNNDKHRDQWIGTLETYAFPLFGGRSVDSIGPNDVLAAISPIWTTKRETARRVRQRIRAVFEWCKVKEYISGANPVEGTSAVLGTDKPDPKHHAALPYSEVSSFILDLRERGGAALAKLAFEFMILTAMRTSEVLFANWAEFELPEKVWVVPAERMKMKQEHRVPLSLRCIEILQQARLAGDGGEYVFPGRRGRQMSTMVFLMALRRMERNDITPHGFRSSFRDWAEERTKFKPSVIEAALAHKVGDKVEAAYLRTKLFTQRIPLMDAWSRFAIAMPSHKVVKMHA
jgi:integrase